MKNLFLIFLLPSLLFCSTKRYVDLNGPQNATHFRSIQAAIDYGSTVAGDTIVVYPGVYNGTIRVNKDIIVMGSGFETTTLVSDNDSTVDMRSPTNNGKLMWFSIVSTKKNGIWLQSGVVTNCVIRGCAKTGIMFSGSTSSGVVRNCVVLENGEHGVHSYNYQVTSNASVINTISYYNIVGYDFYNYSNSYLFSVTYCDGHRFVDGPSNNIYVDPQFVNRSVHPSNLHLQQSSPCVGAGHPDILDPDLTRSDMGYFGGPDCPVFPIVSNITVTAPSPGTLQIQLTGKANY